MATTTTTSTDAAVEARVFWFHYRNEITIALLIAILAILGFFGYRFYVDKRDGAAASLLAAANNDTGYQQVIAQYPSTPSAASAYLLLAESQRNEKKFVEANATLQTFIDKNRDHELVPTAKLGMAANLEALGKSDEALFLYQQIAADYPNSYAAPLAMISQVPLLKAKNRTEDARRVCELMLTKYRVPGEQRASAADDRVDSMWAIEAMRELRLLKPPPVAKPTTPQTANGVPPMLAIPKTSPSAASAPAASGTAASAAPTAKPKKRK
jgi:predicted negative regulator of RcsB-dependent stress response